MLKEAIKVLKENNIIIENPFKEVILSEETKEVDGVLYIKNIPEGLLYLQEHPKTKNPFKHTSTMIDLSRNAVMNFDYFKQSIIRHALLGFDEIWLYMEDVFEVEGYDKFGYMRGKYSKDELKKMVEFADSLGITLIPCVQTLGHFSQFLRWFSSSHSRDTFDVLKVRNEPTYKLIESIIKTLKEVFKTNKIHVGMDETFGFGFGRYYKENGYTPQPELFIEHLKKVNEICLNHGFKEVYIWSDMFFRMYSEREQYYDPTITFEQSFINQIPENIGVVYWDYYNESLDLVEKMIESHKKLNRKVIFASGTWIWTKLTYDKSKTDKTALTHIKASIKHNLDEICFTQWQDDGAYCDYESIFVGLYDVMNEIYDNGLSENLYNNIMNRDYNKEIIYTQLNDLGVIPINLLWDDILFGIYLNDAFGYNYEKMKTVINNFDNYIKLLEEHNLKEIAYDFAKLLRTKLQIRHDLLKNYKTNKPLKKLFPLLDQFKKELEVVIVRFKENWLNRYKFYGLEVIESRLYVFYARIKDAKRIFEDYDNKIIEKLEFLHEPISKEPYLSPKFTDTFYGTKVF